jgi:hypothetical protein
MAPVEPADDAPIRPSCSNPTLVTQQNGALAGTAVEWTARTSCEQGTSADYKFWVQTPSEQWQELTDYSPDGRFTWDTHGLANGAYTFQVWTRAHGSNAAYEAWAPAVFALGSLRRCSSVSVTTVAAPASGASPPGVTLARSAECAGGIPEFRTWRRSPSGAWEAVDQWTTTRTVSLSALPAGQVAGELQTWARAEGSNASFEAWASHTQVASDAFCKDLRLSVEPPAPRVGERVRLVAHATCPTGPEFRFWMRPDSDSFREQRGWNPSSESSAEDTANWKPGRYFVQVWARNQKSHAAYEVWRATSFDLSPAL